MALDGKTGRGARRPDGSWVHLLSMTTHGGVPLGQVSAHGKDQEIAAVRAVLDRIDLRGMTITADALHTQRSHAHYLHHHGAGYVFTVKGNQPRLHARLAGLPWDAVPVADRTDDKGHGRRETRTLQLTSVSAGIGFPHVKRVGRIVRTRRTAGTQAAAREVVYVVTSLDWHEATAAQIAALVRGHWKIENAVHWVRDVVFDEDRHQLRTGNGPRTMACLRNTVLGAIRTRMPGRGIAAATRALSRRLDRLLKLLE